MEASLPPESCRMRTATCSKGSTDGRQVNRSAVWSGIPFPLEEDWRFSPQVLCHSPSYLCTTGPSSTTLSLADLNSHPWRSQLSLLRVASSLPTAEHISGDHRLGTRSVGQRCCRSSSPFLGHVETPRSLWDSTGSKSTLSHRGGVCG